MRVMEEIQEVVEDEAFAFPMSFAQQRLWFLDRLSPGNPSYNIHAAVPINAPLDLKALESAVCEIVRRHEALRTTFTIMDEEPVQLVSPRSDISVELTDLSSWEGGDRDREVMRLAIAESRRPFDLSKGPLLRVGVLKKTDMASVLLLTIHHIVSDGWSMNVLSNELTVLYGAFASNRPSPLPDLEIQYADFAVWQRDWLQGETLERCLDYWRERLANPPSLDLRTDRPRPRVATYRGAVLNVELPDRLVGALRALSHREDCTLFMTLLAGFKTLLCRYTRQTDLVIGSPIANRNRAELESLIGFFVNSLVFRTDLGGDPTFRETMRRVKETALGAYANQDLPFEMLVETLQPDRDLSRNPLFQVTFQLLNVQGGAEEAATGGDALSVQRGGAVFDLAFNLWQSGESVTGQIEYSSDLFDAETVARMFRHYRAVLEEVAANPDLHISCISMLPSDERTMILQDWNATSVAFPPPRPAQRLFEEAADRHPEALAIKDGDAELSYGELDQRANRFAWILRDAGVAPGGCVPVCMERSADLVVAVLGILKAGCAYAPLDPAYPVNRLEFMLRDIDAPVTLVHAPTLGKVGPEASGLMNIDEMQSRIQSAPSGRVSGHDDSQATAYMIYTSGSTGQPKGVEVRHDSLCNLIQWHTREFELSETDRVSMMAGPAFDASVWEIWPALAAGASLHVVSDSMRGDLGALLEWMRIQAVTIAFMPTPLAELALEEYWPSDGSLRVLLTGGDRLHHHEPRDWPFRLYNNYGPTENTVVATCGLVAFDAKDKANPSIGRPIANVRAYVMSDAGELCPPGVPGELWIGGDGLASGYFRQPALTESRFVPNPWDPDPGQRLYRTGDLVCWRRDGTLEFLGRTDQQVKLRGIRIELGEIESVLARHPQVAQAAVLLKGDGADARLVGYVAAAHSEQAEGSGEAVDEHVDHWKSIYDDVYAQPSAESDPTFNIRGWNSSYDGLPIPCDEMRDWVEQTVERITAYSPQRVLEIGFGTGLLLFRIAPRCDRYQAIDFSANAVDYVARNLSEDLKRRVLLKQGAADDLSSFENESFDTVILNSIVQYFPNLTYLTDALRQAVSKTARGGRVFIGDVRNFDLLEVFHATVERGRSGSDGTAADLRARIQKLANLDRELVIDARFFSAFARQCPRVTHLRVLCKRGDGRNELTQFRYDVVLELDGDQEASCRPRRWLDWDTEQYDFSRLDRELADAGTRELGVSGVPNGRYWKELCAFDRIAEAADDARLAEIDLATDDGVNPSDLWELGQRHGFATDIGWFAEGSLKSGFRRLDVIFRRGGERSAAEVCGLSVSDTPASSPSQGQLANDPLQAKLTQDLQPQLKAYLDRELPDAMVPSLFLFMDALPLTPNGKIDRERLPEPNLESVGKQRGYTAPRTDVESRLAGIWSEYLNLDRVGVEDNFFELGGDSILSIQIISRANREGIKITASDMFQHQTIAELAQTAQTVSGVETDQGPVVGEAPLTPIQHWFFEQQFPQPNHFNQAVIVNFGVSPDKDALERALTALMRHHDGLRSRYRSSDSGWKMEILEESEPVDVEHVDISEIPEADLGSFLAGRSTETQAKISLDQGPLLRAVLYDAGPTGASYLLIVIHHLVVDGVSWRIFFEDMTAAYQQALQGDTPELPPKTSSFRDWAIALSEYGRRSVLESEVEYWRQLATTLRASEAIGLVERDGGPNTVESARENVVELSVDETDKLLRQVHGAYKTQMNEILLVALALVWRKRTGASRLHLDLEGHGREPIGAPLDISRTIGWFTTVFPVFLEWADSDSLGTVIRKIKEQVRSLPSHGLSYGVLRHLADDPELQGSLADIPVAPITFNYLGQMGGDSEESVDWRWGGQARGGMNHRSHAIEVNASVTSGRFQMVWTHSANQFAEASVRELASDYIQALRQIVTHCLSPDAGGFTPADFANADLDQGDLDALVSQIGSTKKRRRRRRRS